MLSVMYNEHSGSLYHQKSKRNGHLDILKMIVHRASTKFGLLNKVIGK